MSNLLSLKDNQNNIGIGTNIININNDFKIINGSNVLLECDNNSVTLGTINSGIYNGNIIEPQYGGLGTSLGNPNQILYVNPNGDGLIWKDYTSSGSSTQSIDNVSSVATQTSNNITLGHTENNLIINSSENFMINLDNTIPTNNTVLGFDSNKIQFISNTNENTIDDLWLLIDYFYPAYNNLLMNLTVKLTPTGVNLLTNFNQTNYEYTLNIVNTTNDIYIIPEVYNNATITYSSNINSNTLVNYIQYNANIQVLPLSTVNTNNEYISIYKFKINEKSVYTLKIIQKVLTVNIEAYKENTYLNEIISESAHNINPIFLKFILTYPVNNFTSTSLTLENIDSIEISTVSNNNLEYRATVGINSNRLATISINSESLQDNDLNKNINSATFTYTHDDIHPTLTNGIGIGGTITSAVGITTIPLKVTISEPTDDFVSTDLITKNCDIISFQASNDNTVYNFRIEIKNEEIYKFANVKIENGSFSDRVSNNHIYTAISTDVYNKIPEGILGNVPNNLTAAYDLRKLYTDYLGPTIRVYKPDKDKPNTNGIGSGIYDLYFDGHNNIYKYVLFDMDNDSLGPDNFIYTYTNEFDNSVVITWYDQSINGHDLDAVYYVAPRGNGTYPQYIKSLYTHQIKTGTYSTFGNTKNMGPKLKMYYQPGSKNIFKSRYGIYLDSSHEIPQIEFYHPGLINFGGDQPHSIVCGYKSTHSNIADNLFAIGKLNPNIYNYNDDGNGGYTYTNNITPYRANSIIALHPRWHGGGGLYYFFHNDITTTSTMLETNTSFMYDPNINPHASIYTINDVGVYTDNISIPNKADVGNSLNLYQNSPISLGGFTARWGPGSWEDYEGYVFYMLIHNTHIGTINSANIINKTSIVDNFSHKNMKNFTYYIEYTRDSTNPGTAVNAILHIKFELTRNTDNEYLDNNIGLDSIQINSNRNINYTMPNGNMGDIVVEITNNNVSVSYTMPNNKSNYDNVDFFIREGGNNPIIYEKQTIDNFKIYSHLPLGSYLNSARNIRIILEGDFKTTYNTTGYNSTSSGDYTTGMPNSTIEYIENATYSELNDKWNLLTSISTHNYTTILTNNIINFSILGISDISNERIYLRAELETTNSNNFIRSEIKIFSNSVFTNNNGRFVDDINSNNNPPDYNYGTNININN